MKRMRHMEVTSRSAQMFAQGAPEQNYFSTVTSDLDKFIQ